MIGTQHLTRQGFTLSLDDLNVSEKVKELSEDVVKKADQKTKDVIKDFEEGKLGLLPGEK